MGPLEITLNRLFDSVIIIKRSKPDSCRLQVQDSDGVSTEGDRKGTSSLLILDNRVYSFHMPSEFSYFFVYYIYVFMCTYSG